MNVCPPDSCCLTYLFMLLYCIIGFGAIFVFTFVEFYDFRMKQMKSDIKEIAKITGGNLTEFEALGVLSGQPTADVRENVRGEWIDFSMSIKGVPTEACGVCGEWSLGMGKNFCPNCGADMRGEAND